MPQPAVRHMLAVALVIEVLRRVGLGHKWQEMLVEGSCTPRANILATLEHLRQHSKVDEALLASLSDLVDRPKVS